MFCSIFNQESNDNLNLSLLNVESGFPDTFINDNINNDLSLSRLNSYIIIKEKEKEKENLETVIKPKIEQSNQTMSDHYESNNLLDFNVLTKLNQQNEPLPNVEKENTNKSTGSKTNEILPQKLFKVKDKNTIESRVDYAIKNIKVQISKFLKDYGNALIKKCNFQNKLKNKKLFLPSYPYFTGNSNEKDNRVFLNFTAEQILTYPEEKINLNNNKNKKVKDNRLQRQNKEIIKQFKEYIEEKYPDEVPEQFQDLLNFFRMTYEDIIISFYNSEYYTNYLSLKKAEQYNEQFIKTKGYSLLEKNGLIKLLKKHKTNP